MCCSPRSYCMLKCKYGIQCRLNLSVTQWFLDRILSCIAKNGLKNNESVRNSLLAVWMAGIACSKFFARHSNGWCHPFEFFLHHLNGWHHPFENFPVLFERLQHPFKIFPWPFEWYLKLFWRDGTSVSHLFISCSPAVHFDRLMDIP